MKTPSRLIAAGLAAIMGIAVVGSSVIAGDSLLYSWEGSLQGWTAANATLVNSNFGATDGAQAMLMDDLTSGFKNDVGVVTVNSGPAYVGFGRAGNRIAAGDLDVALEFDFSFDNSNGNSSTGFFMQLGIFVNSTLGMGTDFRQYGTGGFIGGNIGIDFPRLEPAAIADGVTMTGLGATRHLRIPMNAIVAASGGQGLTVNPPSAGSFYQVGFKSNGGWGGTVDWAIDNMRVTGLNIPEPSSILLVALGAVATCLIRRRHAR